ncbi:MAG: amidohydrolase family protein [Anaerolineae bacterium]|nr:amidohydrolase family protein [Anaerolineae bacterium]
MTLTNAHTHLELGWLADLCPDETGRDFLPWMLDLNERRRKMAAMACFVETKFREAANAGIAALQAAGVTHVADVSASGSSIHPLLESDLQGVVYVEVAAQFAEQADRTLAMARYVIHEARPQERSSMRIGLAFHAPYAVHPALWKKGLAYAREEDLPVCIHIAESQAEYDWLKSDSGPLAGYFREMGIGLSSPRKSPVEYLEDLGALDLQPLLIHAIQVDEADVQRIQASGSRVVHCPRSSLRLHTGRMPLERYQKYEVPVYLGTESLACAPSLDVREEIEAGTALHNGQFTAESLHQLLEQPL